MKKLEIITRPEKLETLKHLLDENGCWGMTISSVMGCGVQKGNPGDNMSEYKGMQININLLPKIQVNVVIPDEKLDELLLAIHEHLSSGNVGDGKVFVSDICEAMRIRTGEKGIKAI